MNWKLEVVVVPVSDVDRASGGTVRGKDALRSYWTRALEGNPGLYFELIGVYAGIETLVLHYRNRWAAWSARC